MLWMVLFSIIALAAAPSGGSSRAGGEAYDPLRIPEGSRADYIDLTVHDAAAGGTYPSASISPKKRRPRR